MTLVPLDGIKYACSADAKLILYIKHSPKMGESWQSQQQPIYLITIHHLNEDGRIALVCNPVNAQMDSSSVIRYDELGIDERPERRGLSANLGSGACAASLFFHR